MIIEEIRRESIVNNPELIKCAVEIAFIKGVHIQALKVIDILICSKCDVKCETDKQMNTECGHIREANKCYHSNQKIVVDEVREILKCNNAICFDDDTLDFVIFNCDSDKVNPLNRKAKLNENGKLHIEILDDSDKLEEV